MIGVSYFWSCSDFRNVDWLNDLLIYLLTEIKITFYEKMLGDCWRKLKVIYFAADIVLYLGSVKYNFWPHFLRSASLVYTAFLENILILQFYYLVHNYKNTYPSILIFHFSPYTPKITTYIHLFTYLSLLTR